MKRIQSLFFTLILISFGISSTIVLAEENMENPSGVSEDSNNGPMLHIDALSGLQFPSPLFRISNSGDQTAHNVQLADIDVDGNVLYNNREMLITETFEPGSWTLFSPNTWFIGYGVFSVVITVRCDEEVFSSDMTYGVILGPICFIP